MYLKKILFFLIFLFLLSGFSQLAKGDEYITIQDEIVIDEWERDVDTFQNNPTLYYIYTTFQFASYDEFSNDSSETGSEYYWNVDYTSLITVNDLYLQDTYVEAIKTLSWGNGTANFNWDSILTIQKVFSRILFDTNVFENVSILTDYGEITIENVSSILYVNDTNTQLNISEIDTLSIEVNYDFAGNTVIFNVYDYLDLDQDNYYTLVNSVSKQSNDIHIHIRNNGYNPISIFGVGIKCNEVSSTGIRAGRDFFEWVFQYTTEEYYFYESNSTIDITPDIGDYEAITYDSRIQNEYKGFITFAGDIQDNGFINGSKDVNLDVDEDNSYRNSDVLSYDGGTLGYSYGNISYPCSNSMLFEVWIYHEYNDDDDPNSNDTFVGCGLEFNSNISIWIGSNYFWFDSISEVVRSTSLYVRYNNSYTMYSIKNTTMESNKPFEQYLSFQTTSNSIYVYENSSLIGTVNLDLSNISVLEKFSINHTLNVYGVYPNNYLIDCFGVQDISNPNQDFYKCGYYEIMLLGSLEVGTPDIITENYYGLNLDYNLYRDSYEFGENTQIYGSSTGLYYYVLVFDNEGQSLNENFDSYGQEFFSEVNIYSYFYDLEMLSYVSGAEFNLSLIDLTNVNSGKYGSYNGTSILSRDDFYLELVMLTNETLNLTGFVQQIEYSKFDDGSTYNDGYIFNDYIYVEVDNDEIVKYQAYSLKEFEYRYYYLQSQKTYFKVQIYDGYNMAWVDVSLEDNRTQEVDKRNIQHDLFNYEFLSDYSILDSYVTLNIYMLDVITSTRTAHIKVSIVFESTYLGSDKLIVDNEDQDLFGLLTDIFVNICVNSAILLIIPVFMYKKIGISGFTIGFIISIFVCLFLGLFDTITITMIIMIAFVMLYIQMKKRGISDGL